MPRTADVEASAFWLCASVVPTRRTRWKEDTHMRRTWREGLVILVSAALVLAPGLPGLVGAQSQSGADQVVDGAKKAGRRLSRPRRAPARRWARPPRASATGCMTAPRASAKPFWAESSTSGERSSGSSRRISLRSARPPRGEIRGGQGVAHMGPRIVRTALVMSLVGGLGSRGAGCGREPARAGDRCRRAPARPGTILRRRPRARPAGRAGARSRAGPARPSRSSSSRRPRRPSRAASG